MTSIFVFVKILYRGIACCHVCIPMRTYSTNAVPLHHFICICDKNGSKLTHGVYWHPIHHQKHKNCKAASLHLLCLVLVMEILAVFLRDAFPSSLSHTIHWTTLQTLKIKTKKKRTVSCLQLSWVTTIDNWSSLCITSHHISWKDLHCMHAFFFMFELAQPHESRVNSIYHIYSRTRRKSSSQIARYQAPRF